jgi:hypothetical protein
MFEVARLRHGDPNPPVSARCLLREHLAVRYPGVLTEGEAGAYVESVYRARESWTANFGGTQFTLGRAFYTHLEEDRDGEYFARARASDAAVRRELPGLQERLMAEAARVVGAPVVQREGWCGAGVHLFPARGEVARRGGEVHFDTEGLRDDQLARRAPALSFVLMLQRAQTGGGLRLWDRLYDGDDFPAKPDPGVTVTRIEYEQGELVVFDSYRLHQILPFRGASDRISATLHAALEGETWEVWF